MVDFIWPCKKHLSGREHPYTMGLVDHVLTKDTIWGVQLSSRGINQGFVVKIQVEKTHPSSHADKRPLWGLGELIIHSTTPKSGVENQARNSLDALNSNTQIWNPRDFSLELLTYRTY